MSSKSSLWPMVLVLIVVLSLVAAACGSDDSGDEDGSDTVAGAVDTSDDSGDSSGGDGEVDDGGSSVAAAGGDPVGTATIDGTDYTIVASLQCLVALDQANQISISGDVEEYVSDDPFEWQYGWDSDDGINEFSITLGDEPDDEYWAMGTLSDPQVNGESVTASGTVMSGVDTFEASFQIDCSS